MLTQYLKAALRRARYISYQRVCCHFSTIPATNGSGFGKPSGSSKLAAARPHYKLIEYGLIRALAAG